MNHNTICANCGMPLVIEGATVDEGVEDDVLLQVHEAMFGHPFKAPEPIVYQGLIENSTGKVMQYGRGLGVLDPETQRIEEITEEDYNMIVASPRGWFKWRRGKVEFRPLEAPEE